MKTNGTLPASWTRQSLQEAYDRFDIKDERAICKERNCGRKTPRTFGGLCYTCHLNLQAAIGQPACPGLP